MIADLKRLNTIVQTSNSPASYIALMRSAIWAASAYSSRLRPTPSTVPAISAPNSRRSMSRPLRPTHSSLTCLPCSSSSRMRARAPRAIELLKPPHRPRSAVATTTRWTASRPLPASSGGAPCRSATLAARLASICAMRWANGRAASACSCARLSLEAATSFMALVIFCVCLTLPIRVRRSLRLGIAQCSMALGGAQAANAWV